MNQQPARPSRVENRSDVSRHAVRVECRLQAHRIRPTQPMVMDRARKTAGSSCHDHPPVRKKRLVRLATTTPPDPPFARGGLQIFLAQAFSPPCKGGSGPRHALRRGGGQGGWSGPRHSPRPPPPYPPFARGGSNPAQAFFPPLQRGGRGGGQGHATHSDEGAVKGRSAAQSPALAVPLKGVVPWQRPSRTQPGPKPRLLRFQHHLHAFVLLVRGTSCSPRGASSSASGGVMTKLGSISPFWIRSSSGFR